MGPAARGWPTSPPELRRVQDLLRDAAPEPWHPAEPLLVGGVWFAAPSGSPGDEPGERAWAAAVAMLGPAVVAEHVERGSAGAAYRPGLLALRAGALLERAVDALAARPGLLLVNATGRDHPRGAGLALHIGAALAIPTVGVTDRPLVAEIASEPGEARGDRTSALIGGVEVAAVVRTRAGARPLVVHAAWRTDVTTAVEVVLAVCGPARTPEPLRRARKLARLARARDEGRLR